MNNPKYPIYIISKGRWEQRLTARVLTRMQVPYKIVVEPQEYGNYASVIRPENIIVTPFSNLGQGSIPVRNFVWEHSKKNGDKRHWLLDDNIENFNRLNRNMKLVCETGSIFRAAEDFVDRFSNVPFAGFNYYSFCKTTEKIPPFYINTRIYSCTLIDNSLDMRWRGRYNEDTDLSLRILKAGYCTILFNAFLAGKVTTLRMKGGNTEEVYGDTNDRFEFAESLRMQHPDCVRVVRKFNRWHHQVDYSAFKKNRLIPISMDDHGPLVNNYGMVIEKKKWPRKNEITIHT